MSGFRSQKWDPWLIISQIVAVQALYYLSLGFWICLITLTVGRPPTLDYLFSYENFRTTTWSVRLLSCTYLLNALSSGFAIYYVVGRYKQCLDFSVTVNFYHLIACWIYNSQHPNLFSWYVTHILSIIVMTILSEHFCKKSELRTIPLGNRVDL